MEPEPPASPARTPSGSADRERLARAVASHASYLMFVASRMKGDHLQAEEGASDLAQRTVLIALDRIRDRDRPLPFADEEEMRIWLRRLVRDTWSDTKKKYRARKRTPGARPAPAALSPSGEAMLNEAAQRLAEARRALDPADQQLIAWRDDEGLDFDEIGRRRGYSASYAGRRYREARETLDRSCRAGTDPDSA